MNKISKSELNAINKSIAHNRFAIPIITPTIGILDWTKEEIKKLHITTRKILTMIGSFHQSIDINRLLCKAQGWIIEHLEKAGDTHGRSKLVKEHERSGIVRLGYEFKERIKEITESSDVTEGTKKIHKKEWVKKVTHGYHQTQIKVRMKLTPKEQTTG